MPILAKIVLPPADYKSVHNADYPAEFFTTSKSFSLIHNKTMSVVFAEKLRCLRFWDDQLWC